MPKEQPSVIEEKLRAVQRRLVLSLEEVRASHTHSVTKGTLAEDIFRNFLREYLPSNNRVGEGEVIDTLNSISSQLDVVITNSYHPHLNDLKQPGLFIIEGVACAGEVKSVLTSQDLDVLIESCRKFKSLKPLNQKNTQVIGSMSDISRFVERRPYFIFTFESQLSIGTIYSKLRNHYNKNNTPVIEQIDAVFCLDKGSIVNFGDGKGSMQFSTSQTKSLPGIQVTNSDGEGILLELMSWVSISMQHMVLPSSPLTFYISRTSPVNPSAS